MKMSLFTEEQIAYVLCQGEAGTRVAYVCRSTGIAEALTETFRQDAGTLSGVASESCLPWVGTRRW